jgi:uncharacterized membrane protein
MIMNADSPDVKPAPDDASSQLPLGHQIGQNTESILALFAPEEREITRSQRMLESIVGALGSLSGLAAMLFSIVSWVLGNLLATRFGIASLDPPPFQGLQASIGLGAFFTTLIVLIRQNRLSKMEERRAHLELQVNLLAEQKATKIINLMEELRRDLPLVKDRHDAEAVALQKQTDPESVLAAFDERQSRK